MVALEYKPQDPGRKPPPLSQGSLVNLISKDYLASLLSIQNRAVDRGIALKIQEREDKEGGREGGLFLASRPFSSLLEGLRMGGST